MAKNEMIRHGVRKDIDDAAPESLDALRRSIVEALKRGNTPTAEELSDLLKN